MIDDAAKYFEDCQTHPTSPSIIENSQHCQHLISEVAKLQAKLELNSDTNKLWFMYRDWFDKLTAGLNFELLADWGAYVYSIRDMATFHASSRRRNYTRSTAWYLDEIDSLDEDTLSSLTSSFVIRRNSKQYGIISPDLGINNL